MKKLVLVMILALAINGIAYGQAEPPVARVDYPVSGSIVLTIFNRLDHVDTQTGTIETILQQQENRQITNVQWNPAGERIALSFTSRAYILNMLTTPPALSLLVPNSIEEGVFRPQSWSQNDQILGIVFGADLPYNDLQVVDSVTGVRTTLWRYDTDEPLPENNAYIVSNVWAASGNPVYSDWVLYEVRTTEPGADSLVSDGLSFVIVANHVTGERHVLNDHLGAAPFRISTKAWSPDGRKVVVSTDRVGSQMEIATVLNPDGSWQGNPAVRAAPMLRGRLFVSWLGVEDLLLLTRRTESPDTIQYEIAQVINDGELVTLDFVEMPLGDLTPAPEYVPDGSWHLRADEVERAELSCLFDRALAAQIAVGDVAQVVADDWPLRDAPSVDAAEVTRVPQGTVVNVVGGPYCADGMRWWQVTLADGAGGWLAEADGESYWLE